MAQSVNINAFLSIVRMGIGHQIFAFPEDADWKTIQILGLRHGLSAIIIDGVGQLPENKRPPKEMLLEWIGEVLQGYEYRFEMYRRTIAEMANFYKSHGYKMMVLKGYACSLDWPKPEHRPCGDIDIWQFGKQKEADDALVSSFKNQDPSFKIDKSHHHHTVFNWEGFTVENHYDFVNVHAHRSSAELEKVFKELGKDDSHSVDVLGQKIYLPSPNLHALFLIKHMVSHFAAAEISLRQVLDWAFFVEKHGKEVEWEWLQSMLEKYHMNEFFNLINAICVEDLGFAAGLFPTIQFLPSLKEKVLDDILDPKFTSAEPKGFMSRMIYKYKRWQGNSWKQKLCYNESRWEYFWTGIWAKIIKPSSI
jgi:hypothetical protein